MPINNYLVMGVAPANGERNVALNQSVSILFQKNMLESSLSPTTIRFRKVNGGVVEAGFNYNNIDKRLTLVPVGGLEASTSYTLEIVGGTSGVKSIVDDYMGGSKQYTFYTVEAQGVVPPTTLAASASDGFIAATWQNGSLSSGYTFEVKLSTSNLPDNDGIWPEQNAYTSTATAIDFPKRVGSGSYYVHVRAVKDAIASEWVSTMVAIEETEPTPDGEPSDVVVGIEPLKLTNSYPTHGGYGFKGGRIGLLFSEPLKDQDFASLVSLRKKEANPFFEDEVVEVMVTRQTGKDNVLLIDIVGAMEPGKRYLLSVDKALASVPAAPQEMMIDGNVITMEAEEKTLAQDIVLEFVSEGLRAYATVDEVRGELAGFLSDISDISIYEQILSASEAAYLIVTSSPRYDDDIFVNDTFPFYMKQYVRYKVSYDMAMNKMVATSSGQDKNIKLGDLSVGESGRESFALSAIIKELKQRIKPWEDMLHGVTGRGYATMKSAVYAETGSPYPDFFEGIAEYPELGG